MFVKICGITNEDDALLAVALGADALGFVFYPKSPRHVTLEIAGSIVARVPEQVEKVGVFVNETLECVRDTAKQLGLTAVQLHGDESTEFSRELFRERCPDVPLIFVSGTISETYASESLRQGAIDFVYKHQLWILNLLHRGDCLLSGFQAF